ncbi:hypothetical protein PT974_02798 [Cladobotryum mycophilum]|uniref:Uncharacterized protein n=1 Tax=Cladobotryum mycophilum TaxID=491253 RepID=A0ABR0T0F4_9HYPO
MERDIRRGHGQWRGCYSFKNIVCEDSVRSDCKRSGGLKMGHTYYYYYEVDGSSETYDLSMPSTTACPYMPGQTVNTLNVPMERTLRSRSASMGSMHQENFRTMNPEAKFDNPKPLPPLPSEAFNHRAASASILRHCASSRSLSPAPSWKKFFGRKMQHCEAPRGRSFDQEHQERRLFTSYDNTIPFPTQESYYSRTSTPTEGTRTRDISPESLRRFLCEDLPSRPSSSATERPLLTIPDEIDDIDDDETDDDDNFATSAVSESQSYFTSLSPPPFQRSASSESIATATQNSYIQTPSKSSKLVTQSQPRWSISVASGAVSSPTSEDEPMAFYDSNDEDDNDDDNEDDTLTYLNSSTSLRRRHAFRGYSLPRPTEESKGISSSAQTFASLNSPSLVPRTGSEIPVSGSNLLGGHIDSGLDDFVNELGWMVEVIGNLSDN